MITVSSHTPAALAIPCFTGWLVSAAAAVGDASPIPDALENVPLLTPCWMITPIVPPNTAFLANAAVTTVLISAGTAVMFITIITTAAIRYTVTMNGTIIDAIALIRFTPPITTTARINAMINALTHIGILIALWNPSQIVYVAAAGMNTEVPIIRIRAINVPYFFHPRPLSAQ